MLLEKSGDVTPERKKRESQSQNNTQLWMWLVMEVQYDAVKNTDISAANSSPENRGWRGLLGEYKLLGEGDKAVIRRCRSSSVGYRRMVDHQQTKLGEGCESFKGCEMKWTRAPKSLGMLGYCINFWSELRVCASDELRAWGLVQKSTSWMKKKPRWFEIDSKDS